MNREPNISEIEKLLNHFRETKREHELFEILEKHGIGSKKPLAAIEEETHEINPAVAIINKISKREGLKVTEYRPVGRVVDYFKYKWYIRYIFYYLMLFFGILLFLNAPLLFERLKAPATDKSQIITVQELQEYKMAKSAPLEPGEVVPAENQLIIPKIGVQAPIIFPSTNNEKVIQENLTKGVVHYKDTSYPGKIGNTFITGHSSNFWWIKGKYNYIFVNLNKLAVGDQAKIYYGGNKFIYQVKEIKVVLPTDTSVLNQTDTPVLTLMTCTPTGTNWKRLIVTFDQISPKYRRPRIVNKQIIKTPEKLISTDTNSTGGVLMSIKEWFFDILGFSN